LDVYVAERFGLDGLEYFLEDVSPDTQEALTRLIFCDQMIKQLEAEKTILNRARNGYIEDLKTEAVEQKSGLNLSALFAND
jgi:hypothetical protein